MMINYHSSYLKVFVLHDDILNLLQGLQNLLHFNNGIIFTQVAADVAGEINVKKSGIVANEKW
jgi:hypothetical protein